MNTRPASPRSRLARIKAAHTLVWAFFVANIVAIWVFASQGAFAFAAIAIGIVFIEVSVLALNQRRCPLSDMARRYTDDQRANFDIYLPEWLARRTTLIFGALYVAGIAFTFFRWATQ